ncbi:ImmA/IrrE family metallo-endopeptidase [Patescibacteria group bacterium]|nr:ImmA/IrrE family metallo-endopeptidase [Patescibacteria group bacterium]
MSYQRITIPYLDKDFIKHRADFFREKYHGSSVPVDIEKIIEIKLKIDIIPLPDARRSYSLEALITSNWKSIYVDKYAYDNQDNRLRFSLAHEIGHFLLHKKVYEDLKIKSVTDFYKAVEEIPIKQYGYLEAQANYFANFLLVPREELKLEREKLLKKIKNEEIIKKIDPKMINSYLAELLTRIFDVSAEVIEISLNNLNNNNL